MTSPETAKVVMQETLSRIGIPDEDINILTDTLPSIKQIISADKSTLQATVPINITSLDAVEQFFSFDTTTT